MSGFTTENVLEHDSSTCGLCNFFIGKECRECPIHYSNNNRVTCVSSMRSHTTQYMHLLLTREATK